MSRYGLSLQFDKKIGFFFTHFIIHQSYKFSFLEKLQHMFIVSTN